MPRNLESLAGANAKYGRRADFPALEADIRRRLADCLDGLDQTQEAEEERRLARECVDRAPGDALRHLTQGTLLERQNRHAEACAAFEQALSYTSESDRQARIECMSHLLIACFNAGRPAECLRWAEEVIALGAEGIHLRVAHRMAGVACGNLGRLPESEDHYRRAYDLAAALGDKGVMGEILANLASIQRKRGKLVEAHEACVQAAAVHPKAVRMAQAVRSQILREWGRYDEALELLSRHDEASKLVIPAHERRRSRLRASWIHRASRQNVGGQTTPGPTSRRPRPYWRATPSSVSSVTAPWRGSSRHAGSRTSRDRSPVKWKRGSSNSSATRARVAESCTTWASPPSARGDHENGERYWSRYLELSPDPVHQPTALYFRGECRRQAQRHVGRISGLQRGGGDEYRLSLRAACPARL